MVQVSKGLGRLGNGKDNGAAILPRQTFHFQSKAVHFKSGHGVLGSLGTILSEDSENREFLFR